MTVFTRSSMLLLAGLLASLPFIACKATSSLEASDSSASSASNVPSATVLVPASSSSANASSDWSLHFSPNGGCEAAVTTFIGTARHSVRLMAYGFTSEAIAGALVAKKAQSSPASEITVEVVLDKSDKTAKGSMAYALQTGNVKVWIDSKHPIMHDKVVIVDDLFFETGSFNFTNAAEHSNAENCLIERDPEKAKLYAENWRLHQSHSAILSGN